MFVYLLLYSFSGIMLLCPCTGCPDYFHKLLCVVLFLIPGSISIIFSVLPRFTFLTPFCMICHINYLSMRTPLAMHTVVGIAYGMLTTLPPVFGLYSSFFPVLIYCFFGSSKHMSMGKYGGDMLGHMFDEVDL